MSNKFAKASVLAEQLENVPTIHRSPNQIVEMHEEKKKTALGKPIEKEEGYLLLLRQSLKDELKLEALKNKMTIKQFIMNALKDQGLEVTNEDMLDRRKI